MYDTVGEVAERVTTEEAERCNSVGLPGYKTVVELLIERFGGERGVGVVDGNDPRDEGT